jgi:hypothetical protein
MQNSDVMRRNLGLRYFKGRDGALLLVANMAARPYTWTRVRIVGVGVSLMKGERFRVLRRDQRNKGDTASV